MVCWPVPGWGTVNYDFLFAGGVIKNQSLCIKCDLAFRRHGVGAILFISNDGVPDEGELGADLVEPSSMEVDVKQAGIL